MERHADQHSSWSVWRMDISSFYDLVALDEKKNRFMQGYFYDAPWFFFSRSG
jgi:hypothetical protein